MSTEEAARARPLGLPPISGLRSLVALVFVALVFWPALSALIDVWSDADRPYSHGILVGPLSALLAVRACRTLRQDAAVGSWPALALFVGASVLWLVGFVADILAVQEVLLPAILFLAVATVAGWRAAGRLLFPLSFLYFAIPVWDYAVPVLQELTVDVVGFVVNLWHVPVFVEGNRVAIPEGVFEIADGCAGLHYFIVALTISSLYSYLNFTHLVTRALFVGIGAAFAIITNWVRVTTLVLFGHFTDMQHYLITHEHYYYGWALYLVALVPTFLIGRALLAMDASPKVEALHATVWRLPALSRESTRRPRRSGRFVIGVFLIVLASLVTVLQFLRDEGKEDRFQLVLPEGSGGWIAESMTGKGEWSPVFPGADGHALGVYRLGQATAVVSIAVYRSQSQGRELVGGDNNLYGVGFRPISVARVPASGIKGLQRVYEYVVRSADGRDRLIWNWYSVGERLVAGELDTKLWQLPSMLMGRDSGAALTVSMACTLDCESARSDMSRFAEAMGDVLSDTAIRYQYASGEE